MNSALASNPPVLQSLTPGITIAADPPSTTVTNGSGNGGSTSTGGSSGGGTIVNSPEPLSMLLWSAVVVGMFARNRMLKGREDCEAIAVRV